ncbi:MULTISPECIES: thiamine-phosphate kinase [Acinetobacter]|jgi:thiamine-monophosphate kinase|uniref:thiamine-phosphate kinase n=1 Tax=Acinetobacter TaxID=469 RepID=UPI0018A31E11|nr:MULTISPECIES: thiamine-phosphate kinase [Acinetobacter]MBF7690416.1 thiamine-phosphate kinase [Acinetobacter pollinis]MBF7693135.1 thiamine-phosphate kinase [Acinetobacter pollinis]MBF7697965.1 thiamine-phosphate kinase [Acinetobacter pollinis]MBF7700876.1 thiamine-phosphate kinase [Acinetobacter pollinis]WEV49005.1 thiamine-phosphate kinase [Acinetobacter sp. ESL0695]
MAEFSIIDRYFKQKHARQSNVNLGIGDDSALITPPENQQLVICTDTLVEGRHFPSSTTAHAVGWKSVAVNLSDIAAMGATPHSILLAITLPKIQEDWLDNFCQGLFACCEQYGVELIGGDTTQGPHLTISVTALGWVPKGQAITRSGAEIGDYIVVSGQLGDAAFGLQHLGHPLQKRLDYPTPRCELGKHLLGFASSMIDLSDGLIQDLQHILNASNVGATLQLENLPTDNALHSLSRQQQWQYAIAGGDDYELCFTISPENYKKLCLQKPNVSLSVIGYIESALGLRLTYQNEEQALNFHGYQHFA